MRNLEKPKKYITESRKYCGQAPALHGQPRFDPVIPVWSLSPPAVMPNAKSGTSTEQYQDSLPPKANKNKTRKFITNQGPERCFQFFNFFPYIQIWCANTVTELCNDILEEGKIYHENNCFNA